MTINSSQMRVGDALPNREHQNGALLISYLLFADDTLISCGVDSQGIISLQCYYFDPRQIPG